MSFDKQMLQQITDLLTPLVVNVQERRRLLSQALGIDHPLIGLIDFEGPSSIFLPNMIDRLFRYGKLDDGRPALWALLEYARSYVGKMQKHQIDAFRADFDLPPPPRLDHIFVSYSRQNEMDARRIVGDLRDAGLRVWYDREKIKGGENWRQAIERGIDSADHFLFCLSPSSIRSDYARDELLCAHQKNKPIYVAMLENCPLDMGYQDFEDLKWLLQLHIIDFTQREQYGARLRELIHSLPGYAPPDSYYLEKIEPQNLPNPFRGLEVFTELQASFYAGREDEIQNLVGRLQIPERSRLLCIVGTSGSGKSSLVRAGLVPALRDAFPWWRKLIVTPGQNPVNVLADGLQELLGSATQQDTRHLLRQEINALDDIAADLLAGQPEEAQLLLIIDQFEELFIQSSKEESEHFIALLLRALTKPTSRVQAIITFRADYFGHLSSSSELAHLIESNLVYIADMKVEQLRRCIELPARRALVDYEEGLVEQILEDVRAQPGALPLLEYALTALFERKVERLMTFEAYRQLGGIEGALATHAQEIYMTFNALEKKTLQRILLRLADVNEVTVTRRRVRRSEFAFSDTSDEVVQKILIRLTDAETRLLVATLPLSDSVELNSPSAVESDPLYEVSHEAIFLHWPTLREWIDQERANLRALSQVRASLRRWQTGSHTVSLLADELLLSETAEIEDSLLSRGEKQYLDLSQLRKLVQSSTSDTPAPYKEISYRIEGLAAQGVATCIIIDTISQKPLSVTAMRRVIPHLQVLASKQEKAGRILLDWGLTADTREIRKEALQSWWATVKPQEAVPLLVRETSPDSLIETLSFIKADYGLPFRSLPLLTHLRIFGYMLRDSFSALWQSTLAISAVASLGVALTVSTNLAEIYSRGQDLGTSLRVLFSFLWRVLPMSGLSAVSLLLIGICAHGFALLLAGQYTQRMRTLGALVGSSLGLGISFGILAPFSSPESLTDIFDLSIENLSNTFAGFPVHGALLAAVALIGMLGAKILTSYFFRKPLSRWVQYIFCALSGGTAAALYASLMLPAACAYAKEINGYNLSLLCPALRHMGEQLPLAYFWTGALLALSVIDLNLGLIRDRDPKPPSTQRKG